MVFLIAIPSELRVATLLVFAYMFLVLTRLSWRFPLKSPGRGFHVWSSAAMGRLR